MELDISALDWDDTALIKAYDRGMKLTRKALSKSKDNKDASNKEKLKSEKKWNVGDYCQAVYPVDGLLYEAKIINLHRDSCIVEYIGYDDEGEVELDCLEESLGKNSRKRQRKRVKEAEAGYNTSDTDYSRVSDIRAIRDEVEQLKSRFNQPPQPEYNDFQRSLHGHYQPQPPPATGYNYPLPTTAVQRVEDGASFMPPPAPPMPQCPTVARDPALTAMLVSWYMAGYYTGLHQNQKSSHCSMTPKHCYDYHDSPGCCRH